MSNSLPVNYRFDEDKYLKEALDYITGTYGQHYGHEVDGKNIQVVDLWEGLGSLMTTSRDTSIKYLTRYGKKDGHNKKDLLKAIHYIVLMMYASRNVDKKPVDILKNNGSKYANLTGIAQVAVIPQLQVVPSTKLGLEEYQVLRAGYAPGSPNISHSNNERLCFSDNYTG